MAVEEKQAARQPKRPTDAAAAAGRAEVGKGRGKSAGAGRKPKKKLSGKALKQRRIQVFHKALRFAVQIMFFVLAPGVFTSCMNGVHSIFNDLGVTQPVEFTSFVVILAAALAYTILFGRFFCGYACAFGTMGDVLYFIGTPLRKLVHLEGKQIRGKLAAVLRWVKFVLLVAICAMCFTGFWDTVSSHNPWTVFGRAVAGEFSGFDAVGLGLLIAIMVFQMLFERSFCRFLCPMGAVFSLMPVLPFSQYGRKVELCGKRWCNRCIDHCPAGIYPDRASTWAGECFECGRCADLCPLNNASLVLRLEKAIAEGDAPAKGGKKPSALDAAARAGRMPIGKPGEGEMLDEPKPAAPKRTPRPKVKWRFRGTSVGYVLARAAVLLGMLWLVGATRFLPAVSEVLPNLPWL